MERKSNGLGKFLAGAAIGVGLGILFAPKSGAETRKELKEKFDDLVKKVKELDMQDVRDSISTKVAEIKAELADLDKEKVIAVAKEKAQDIKLKLDDLYETAKEKATPVVQKAVDDVRMKTIAVLKDTIDKLEKNEKKSKGKKQIKAEE